MKKALIMFINVVMPVSAGWCQGFCKSLVGAA